MRSKDSKVCLVCGRNFEYRKKWEKVWDEVLYCSDACRRNKSKEAKLDYENLILKILKNKPTHTSICPSEVLDLQDKTNKEKIELVRRAARRLAHSGQITILQNGKVVDPNTFKGPIRLTRNKD